MNEEVRRCLAEEYLLHPRSDTPSSLSVFRTIFDPGQGTDSSVTGLPDSIRSILAEAPHLLIVLVDGLGLNVFDRLPTGCFLKSRPVTELRSIYPSTTSSALVSYASGRWPSDHGILGWDTRIPARNLTATVLPFVERTTRNPLGEYGASLADVFPVTGRWGRQDRDVRLFLPETIAMSTFSEWFASGAVRVPFRNLLEAVRLSGLWLRDVTAAGTPSCTYLYIPDLDTTEHHFGPHTDETLLELLGLDRLLEMLKKAVPAEVPIVVTSDHGQIYVPADRQYDVSDDGAFLELLEFPPTGEPRNPVFHVVPGLESRFTERFLELTRGDFTLIVSEEAERLEIFGPAPYPAETRARMGTHIGIALTPAVILYFPTPGHRYSFLGFHGGLSSEEMRIPLILL